MLSENVPLLHLCIVPGLIFYRFGQKSLNPCTGSDAKESKLGNIAVNYTLFKTLPQKNLYCKCFMKR